MKQILIFILILSAFVFGQQINRTWGYTTAGIAYTQTGSVNADSTTEVSIVFDLQDWYSIDWNPPVYTTTFDIGVSGDSTLAQTVVGNSDALMLGTLWLRQDAKNATDSLAVLVEAFPGNMIYHPGGTSRITAANINFSTTAITIQDSTNLAKGDVQWTPYNIYLHASSRILPPEFVKVTFEQKTTADDSVDYFWDFAYPAVYQSQQEQRTSRGTIPTKSGATLH